MTTSSSPPLPTGPREYNENTPNAARMYDYYLGGVNNFDADRALADAAEQRLPYIKPLARLSRAWLRRVVSACLEEGIDQFLDLGSGIPTVNNVHEIVHAANPHGRVLYVDYDATAVSHAQKLLRDNTNAAILHADIRDPGSVLGSPEAETLLDFSRPIGLLMAGILLYVGDEYDPPGLIGTYRDACAPGSLLPLSIITLDEADRHAPDTAAQMRAVMDVYDEASERLYVRSRDVFESWFTGTTLLDPGITLLPHWRPAGEPDPDAESPAALLGIGGVGRIG